MVPIKKSCIRPTTFLLMTWIIGCSAKSIRGSWFAQNQDTAEDDDGGNGWDSGWISRYLYAAGNFPHSGGDLLPTVPAGCLDDPSHPSCKEWHSQYEKARAKIPVPAPTILTSYVTDFPIGARSFGATSAPTKDMCYGNMAKNVKFCNSEMPSVSLEPSEQPTSFPGGQSGGGGSGPGRPPSRPPTPKPTPMPSSAPTLPQPSNKPTIIPSSKPSQKPVTETPSRSPTIAPSNQPTDVRPPIYSFPGNDPPPSRLPLQECEGDCDWDNDCDDGLVCFQREENEAVPGCAGGESDGSRNDYCISEPPVPAPTEDNFCLQMYWQVGYFWQGENFEREWCIVCSGECQEGSILYIEECGWNVVRFDFVILEGDEILVQVAETNLCLERFESTISLSICDANSGFQRWTATAGSFDGSWFEIAQTFHGQDYCLTTHHHPKAGEEIELFECDTARKDETSLWKTC